MSKEAEIKVVKIQTCVLKVYIHCDGCKQKVKKLLRKIEGVYSVSIDAEQGKVTVFGNVDPQILIKKLGQNSKHAELWPSKGGNPQLNKQFQAIQIDNGEGPKGGKPQKGGKDQKGQQQQQLLHQIKGLKDLKPSHFKGQKSVRFHLPEDDGDGTDYGFDDYDYDDDDMDDDGFDDDFESFDMYMDPDELKAHLKMKAMNQQNPPMGAPKNGKNGGAGGDGQVQNKAMVGNNDPKNGNGGKKGGGGNNGGGQSQGGGAGVAKNGGAQDPKNGANGGNGNNKGATNGTNGGNNNASSGGKKGGGGGGGGSGGGGKNDMGHAFHQMDLSSGANVGQMRNLPMHQMGNIPAVQGLPAAPPPRMNAGGYFQGAGPEFPAGNPYHQYAAASRMNAGGYFQGAGPEFPAGNPYHQYAAAMMQQQQQRQQQAGMYARPAYPPYPVAYTPQPPAGESYSNYFSDENANGCTIM